MGGWKRAECVNDGGCSATIHTRILWLLGDLREGEDWALQRYGARQKNSSWWAGRSCTSQDAWELNLHAWWLSQLLKVEVQSSSTTSFPREHRHMNPPTTALGAVSWPMGHISSLVVAAWWSNLWEVGEMFWGLPIPPNVRRKGSLEKRDEFWASFGCWG